MPEPEVKEVELFGNTKGPFGDSRLQRDGAYESTMHMAVEAGEAVPFFAGTEVAISAGFDFAQEIRFAVDWTNTNNEPIVLFLAGMAQFVFTSTASAFRINADGTISLDKTFPDLRLGRIPGAMHDDGGTMPYIFACFGTTGNIQYRDQSNGGWFTNFAGTPLQADGLFSENGNLWAIIGHTVRKWPAGTNPISGTAGGAISVGTADTNINGVGLLSRSAIIFVKPDGLYVYDVDTDRFELLADLSHMQHDLTGVGTFTWNNEVYVPLGWGGMLRVAADLQVVSASPLPRTATPGPNTPGGSRVKGMVADASYLYAALEPFYQRAGLALSVHVRTSPNDSSFNNRDAVSTDDDPSTEWLNGDVGSAGFAYVGVATTRFGGVLFDHNTSASKVPLPSVFTVDYWNGSAWTSLAHIDYTQRFTTTGAIIPQTVVPADWATRIVGGQSAYWLRFNFSSANTFSIAEVRVLPEVAPLAGTNVGASGNDQAGLRTHIIRGYPVGGEMFWEDVISHVGDVGHALLLSRIKSVGGGRNLLALGPRAYVRFPLTESGRPQQSRYPDCVNGFASLLRLSADDRIGQAERAPTTQKGVRYVEIRGRNFDEANDLVQAWISWDGAPPVFIGDGHRLPARINVPSDESGRGYEYAVTVGLEDGVRDEFPPAIAGAVAGVYVVEASANRP